ncbi:MAG: hypothetical protein L0219_05030, partial [Phycisphaerales bacterium]|nr:hypothetical protein [Phycisphaerales bacterium]
PARANRALGPFIETPMFFTLAPTPRHNYEQRTTNYELIPKPSALSTQKRHPLRAQPCTIPRFQHHQLRFSATFAKFCSLIPRAQTNPPPANLRAPICTCRQVGRQ